MTTTTLPDEKDAVRLRREIYNAEVCKIIRVHNDLMLMRVKPDFDMPEFDAGQYTVLGLGAWEPRVAGVQFEPRDAHPPDGLIKRAYSISCTMLDDRDELVRACDLEY